MRLAHVTTVDLSLRFLLREQLYAFRDAGFEVIGVSAPGPWTDDLKQHGIPHVAVTALTRRVAPIADAAALLMLVGTFRRYRPDIVHIHTPKAGVLGRIAARMAGVPVIIHTNHGVYPVDGSGARRWFFLTLERLAACCSDFELCVNREDLEMLRRAGIIDSARSAYLGEGVNLQTFDPARSDRQEARAHLGIPASAVVVGTVGRLVWEKGYQEFFTMAERLRRDEPDAVVLAIGPQEPAKRDAVPDAVIEDLTRRQIVRFTGTQTDMPPLYAAMDVFVLPSYREGFPRSAVEAAAMGLPLVLTDIRGCRDVVADGRNGFLVPPRDAHALFHRVLALVRDAALRERLGRESRRRALAEFNEQRVIAITLDVYRRLLAEKQGVELDPPQRSSARG